MMDLKSLKAAAKKVARRRGLSLLVLFGSQARGKTHTRSDIDIGILTERPIGLRGLAEIQLELSEQIRCKNVEVVDLKTAPPLLLKEVAEDGILLYEKRPSLFAHLRVYCLKRFMEADRLLAVREESLKRFIGV